MKMAELLFVVAYAIIPAQMAGQAGSSAATIRALEHDWVDGQSRNNNAVLNLIFDNALVYVEYGKLVSKGEYLSRIKGLGGIPQPSQIVAEPMTVKMFGSTAIVVGTYRERKATAGGLRRWRFIDTWVYKKSGWVLVAAAASPVSR
jgi:hypothetical protein